MTSPVSPTVVEIISAVLDRMPSVSSRLLGSPGAVAPRLCRGGARRGAHTTIFPSQ
jgi:hypothetical protein